MSEQEKLSDLVKLTDMGLLTEEWINRVDGELRDLKYAKIILGGISEEDGRLKYTFRPEFDTDMDFVFSYIYQITNLEILELTERIYSVIELNHFPMLDELIIEKETLELVCEHFDDQAIRKLSINDGWMVELPDEISKLQKLEYLGIHCKNFEFNERTVTQLASLPLKKLNWSC